MQTIQNLDEIKKGRYSSALAGAGKAVLTARPTMQRYKHFLKAQQKSEIFITKPCF